jgi:FkbM family methyltransferase
MSVYMVQSGGVALILQLRKNIGWFTMNSSEALAKLRSLIHSGVKRGIIKTTRSLGYELKRLRPEPPPQYRLFESMLSLRDLQSGETDYELKFLTYCLNNLGSSNAQLLQDLFVLFHLDNKVEGYFVEFGAADGITISNTFLLESQYGWSGIVAEPARRWRCPLKQNRNCSVDFRCVWRKSGEMLRFNETVDPGFATIQSFSYSDYHANNRTKGNIYDVQTVSLTDLLRQYDAPKVIDYLSIDTEGSELEILNSFTFHDYVIRVITVEHNHSDRRIQIYKLLTSKGYKRVFDQFSMYDDWYVRTS